MANYNQYPSEGIDGKIKILQNIYASHLGWAGVNFFGRVSRVMSSDGNPDKAEIYASAAEGTDVYYDDQKAKAGSVFFIDSSNHKSKDGGMMEAEVKAVFMLNLKELFPDVDYRADSEAQMKCLNLAKRSCVLHNVGIEKEIKNILKGFDTETVKAYDSQPFHVFAITGTIRYSKSNCKH